MIAHRPHPKSPVTHVPHPAAANLRPSEAQLRQWRAIYALCRPEELLAEEVRLAREAAENITVAPQARLRRALVRERLAALGAS